jgi:hypothetical protein
MSSGKQAARARPWATCAESSISDSSKTVSRTEIGPGPNSNSSSQATKFEEDPSAGIEGSSVLPFFFQGASFSL